MQYPLWFPVQMYIIISSAQQQLSGWPIVFYNLPLFKYFIMYQQVPELTF